MRVIQTEASTRFVGTASFSGITGAPGPHDRVGARSAARRVPRRPDARPRAALAPRARADGGRLPDRPGLGEHDRQARGRDRGQPADRGRARLPAPAARRARDERRDVRAPGHAGQPRHAARARRHRARARHRRARLAGGVGDRPAARAARAARRRRAGARAPATSPACKLLVTAGGTREPIDAVRFIGNRSSGRMGFALAERAARRGAEVTVVAANVALPRTPGVDLRRRRDRRRAQGRVRAGLPGLRRPADGRRRRRLPAGRAPRGQDQEGRRGRRPGPPARAHRRRAHRAWPPRAAPSRC